MSTTPEQAITQFWNKLGSNWLPFADAASVSLPLGRLIRLSAFQLSVGMAMVLLNGTLNRVMIVELGVSTTLVAAMISLPLLFAPLRALVGHRSDNHVSAFGLRRIPYMFMGTMLLWGGLAVMPFAIILLSGDSRGPEWLGQAAAAVAFLAVGAGFHITQTAGLALANDLATPETRPRVVAFLYVMLLFGMIASALAFGALLENFGKVRLIQVIQGSAVVALVLNVIAVWKQEPRNDKFADQTRPRPPFGEAWRSFLGGGRVGRLLVALGLGTAAFGMQDVLLEPYGGEVLGLSVSATTLLTALLAGGTVGAFLLASRRLRRGEDPHRLAAMGTMIGVVAFSAVIFSNPLGSTVLFRIGTLLIGFGGGLFAVGMLTAAMDLAEEGASGLALGVWGAVQATSLGLGIAIGGGLRDLVAAFATEGRLGPALTDVGAGYGAVYHLEILLLFATLVALGPLVSHVPHARARTHGTLGLAEMPG
ncbi:MAG: BCD family MFS transporter [Pseudomonadales bacterium]|nr:BCD family MFS transporter [Pseudomonadales bacterium]